MLVSSPSTESAAAPASLILFHHLPRVASGTYWKLLDYYPTIDEALSAPLSQLKNVLPEEAVAALKAHREQGEYSELAAKVQHDLAWARDNNIHILTVESEHYPPLLRDIKRCPPILYVRGDVNCLSRPQLGMVGSRKPSPTGMRVATGMAAALAEAGFVISSGLALGIDTCAHEGVVSKKGQTIAVLGTGIDLIYPARNRRLADDIIANGGAIISEFPIGCKAHAHNFPQRNRIISGLSAGVLVVEAAVKSGSLITARYAIQQNREVFAVPGSVNNPLARGCHALIKDGAKLVESAHDIVEELDGFLGLAHEQLALLTSTKESEIPLDEHEQQLLQYVDYDSTSLDTLAQRSGIAVGELMASLLTLELKGLVAASGGGYLRLSKPV